MPVMRVFVEKKPGFDVEAQRLRVELRQALNVTGLHSVRILMRYDVENLHEEVFEKARGMVFSQPNQDTLYEEAPPPLPSKVLAVESLPGRYDQHADDIAQCLQLIGRDRRPAVVSAKIYALEGDIDEAQFQQIRQYVTDLTECRACAMDEANRPDTLAASLSTPEPERTIIGFADFTPRKLSALIKKWSLSLSVEDLACCQATFRDHEHRDPSLAELRLIDACWSERRRHTTLRTIIDEVSIDPSPFTAPIEQSWQRYLSEHQASANAGVSLLDLAISQEIRSGADNGFMNGSFIVDAQVDGRQEPWLVTVQHALIEALAAGAYAYQEVRIAGCGIPLATAANRRRTSAVNQIGLAAGKVQEVYHPGFGARRLELGAVIAAAPLAHLNQVPPGPGDAVLRVGGRGLPAFPPYVAHSLQRLFRNPDFSHRVKRRAAIGADGVCVALSKLVPGLRAELDTANAEFREGVACVADSRDVSHIMRMAAQENLACDLIGLVTEEPRLYLRRRGQEIVNMPSAFLETNGAPRHAKGRIAAPANLPYPLRLPGVLRSSETMSLKEKWVRVLGDINVCSQRRLVEQFDGTVGGDTVIAPYGGAPNEAMAALLPVSGVTTTMTILAHGCDPALSEWSPYHGAVYAVLEAVAKVVAIGGDASACRLTLQANYPRAGKDSAKWGVPVAALLGALDAGREMGTPSVGCNKMDMGGSNEAGVAEAAHILVAFAVAAENVLRAVTPEFKGPNHALARLTVPRDAALLPDYATLRAAYDAIHVAMRKRQILSAHTIGHGGLAAALFRSHVGSSVGCVLNDVASREPDAKERSKRWDDYLFLPDWGGLVLELADGAAELLAEGANAISGLAVIGHTTAEPVIAHKGMRLSLDDAQAAWEATLADVFPVQAAALSAAAPPPLELCASRGRKTRIRTARPRVCVPCFPGTTGELESARAFERAGATSEVVVFRNITAHAVADSVRLLAQAIGRAQIVMLSGGFAPGVGMFIATALHDPYIADAVAELLNKRDGLLLGICDGFQALIQSGLLPYGTNHAVGEQDPALTSNVLNRYVSTYVHTVVASVKSPWMNGVEPGQVHAIPVAHGVGRFVCGEARLKELYAAGQIITQYCEPDGTPAMRSPHNPNGSAWAVEGICSPDGRILGKMGHSERVGPGVAVNIPGEKDQKLFASGVRYFA